MQPKRETLINQPLPEQTPNSTPPIDLSIPSEGLFLVPVFFLFLLSGIFIKQSNFKQALLNRIVNTKNYYRIPCFRCQFFTENQYIQCAVQPCIVLNKEAIGCPDYSPKKGKFG
jgi:hypothetical protein